MASRTMPPVISAHRLNCATLPITFPRCMPAVVKAPATSPMIRGRGPDGGVDHGKAQAHGQGIDAGGHGQHDHGHAPGGVLGLAVWRVTPERRSEHALGHEGQQNEGHPMVVGLDPAPDRQSGTPADDGHHGLEKAEVPGQAEGLPRTDRFQRHTGGDGNGKGIHGQGHGQGQGVDHVQNSISRQDG